MSLSGTSEFINSSLHWGFAHFLGDVEAVVDEGSEAEEGGADLEEEGAGVAVLGEKLGFSTMLRLRLRSLYMQNSLVYYYFPAKQRKVYGLLLVVCVCLSVCDNLSEDIHLAK